MYLTEARAHLVADIKFTSQSRKQRRHMEQDPRCGDLDADSDAVLIPGWGGSSADFRYVRTTLREQGVAVSHVSLAYKRGALACAEHLTGRLKRRRNPVHLVGHSYGGIIAALAAAKAPELVSSVTTICSPIEGHWAAESPLALLSRPLRDLCHGSACMALVRGFKEAPPVPFLAISARHDLLVPFTVPSESYNSLVVQRGHASTLCAPETLEAVSLFLTSDLTCALKAR